MFMACPIRRKQAIALPFSLETSLVADGRDEPLEHVRKRQICRRLAKNISDRETSHVCSAIGRNRAKQRSSGLRKNGRKDGPAKGTLETGPPLPGNVDTSKDSGRVLREGAD